jgi:hypothetical protein
MDVKISRFNDGQPEEALSVAEMNELISIRAYELYQQRAAQDGSEIDDWLRAEIEIIAAVNELSIPGLPDGRLSQPDLRLAGKRRKVGSRAPRQGRRDKAA